MVSKIESNIIPRAPAIAKNIPNPLNTFSFLVVLCASNPLCRRNLSAMKEISSRITVIVAPVINSGFRNEAPMSEMYAICWFDSMEPYFGLQSFSLA